MALLNQANKQSGQVVIEYVLLLGVIMGMFIMASRGLAEMGLSKRIVAPIQESFKMAYQYGHPKAKGFDDKDGPYLHPRVTPDIKPNNFRIFINPSKR